MSSTVENCRFVVDTIHFISYDTIHQVHIKTLHQVYRDTIHHVSFDTSFFSLDTSLSFDAFKYAHSTYNAIYTNLQNDMSNIIMIFAFVIAVLTLFFGANFIWQNGAGLRFFRKNVKEMKLEASGALTDFKLEMVSMHITMGTQFLKNTSGKPSKNSLEQFYFALTYLISLDFEKKNSRYYNLVLDGIQKNQEEAKTIMQQSILNSLENLKDKVAECDADLRKKIGELEEYFEYDVSYEAKCAETEDKQPSNDMASPPSPSIDGKAEDGFCSNVNSAKSTEQGETSSISKEDEELEDDDDSEDAKEEKETPKELDTSEKSESKDTPKGSDSPK